MDNENTLWKDLEQAGAKVVEKHPGFAAAVGYGVLTIGALAFSWFFTRSIIVSAIKLAR